MVSQQNARLGKYQVDEIANQQNDKLIKWQVGKVSS